MFREEGFEFISKGAPKTSGSLGLLHSKHMQRFKHIADLFIELLI